MKTYEILFNYTKEGEEPERRDVIVLRETDEALAGYDMKYLNDEEKDQVKEIFRSHEIINNFEFQTKKDPSEMTDLDKKIKALNRAWRRFHKSRMSEINKKTI